MKRLFLCFAATALFFQCCSSEKPAAEEEDGADRTIILSEQSLVLKPGEKRDLNAKVSDGAPVVWNSSDWDAVSVSSAGTVSANTFGTATITASSGKASAFCEVTVPLATVSPSSATLKVGETIAFSTESIPQGLDFEWSSSDESVISVDKGVATALSEGTALVIARAANLSANAMITVSDSDPDYVFIDRCESINENKGAWQTDAGSPTLDSSDPTEGLYCISKEFPGAAVTFFSKVFGKSVDASIISLEKGVFCFDLYISSVPALRLDEGDAQIEIASSATLDEQELHWMFRSSLGLEDGWNHLELPLSEADANGEIDMSRICRVRIYNTANNGAVLLKLDNLKLIEK